jgi:hypothetical protein
MICLACKMDNKEGSGQCRKCGATLQMEPLWAPSWAWHFKVLGGIYIALIVVYFALSAFLKKIPEPYRMRQVPSDVTPWLKK